MGVRRWAFVLGVAPLLGCGLIDGDDRSLDACAEVPSGKPALLRTFRTDTETRVETSVIAMTAEGSSLRRLIDSGSDGQADEETLYTLDEEGRITRAEDDLDLDGTADEITENEYDGSHLVLSSVDENADGVPESVTTWDYSVDRRELQESDVDLDGDPDWTHAIFYGPAGERIREEHDQDGDGQLEYSVDYTYEGALLVQEAMNDDDEAADRVTTYTYDADHDDRLSGYVVVYDALPQGHLQERDVARCVYDDAGLLQRIEEDDGDDGSIEVLTRWGYDAEGRRISEERQGIGSYSLCEFEYDEGPEPTVIRCSNDADPAWEYVTSTSKCPG